MKIDTADLYGFVPCVTPPNKPGVLVAVCPAAGEGIQYKVIAVKEGESLQQIAKDHSIGWAAQCSEYIKYFVREVDDAESRHSLAEKLLARHRSNN